MIESGEAASTAVTHRCMGPQSYYPDDEPGHGQWWSGAVIMDQATFLDEAEVAQQLANAWASEVHWERFTIHWDEPPVRHAPPPLASAIFS